MSRSPSSLLRSRVWGPKRLTVAAVVGLALLASAGWAGKPPAARAAVTKALKAAQRAATKGDWATTAAQLQTALTTAREQAPLQITDVAVTRARPTGFGVYEPAEGNVAAGRDVMLYVQLAGVHHRPLTDGRLERDLAVSAAFTYQDPEDGPLPLGEKTLGEQRVQVRAVTSGGEAFIGVNVNLSEKAPAGRYDLVLKVEDRVAKRAATAPVHFVLR